MGKGKEVKQENSNPEELIQKMYQEKIGRASGEIAAILKREGLTLRVTHRIEIVPMQ